MTIAKIHPTGLDTIDLVAANSKTFSYSIKLETLDLHESERLEVAYSEGSNVDGGEAISSHGPLVPITFDVITQGIGASEDASRQQLLQQGQALELALCNVEGGYFEFKPSGLGAGVRSTFYRYIQSRPPRLRAKARNNWDVAPQETQPSYICTIEMEIELQTQPFATSDPDSPITVLTPTTIYNQGNVTILAADVKGTCPALTQLRIRNMTSGTWAAIEKLWYARRTKGTLANFAPILEGGTPDTNSSIWWSTESDTTRRSNNFQRFNPPVAGDMQWASLNYSISNIGDHEGKAAVAVVCRSWAEHREDWDLKAALAMSDMIVETGIKNVAAVGMWTVCILGELDIPPTPLSADESHDVKLYLYLRRQESKMENIYTPIDVDFVMLLYVDEYPQQVTIPGGYTNAYKLLMENFVQEICHVVDQSTLAFEKAAEPLCPLLNLQPGVDNRIDLIWERLNRLILYDDFEDWEACWWAPLEDFESQSYWYPEANRMSDTTRYVEDTQAINFHADNGSPTLYANVGLNLIDGRFTDDDFVYYALRVLTDAEMDALWGAGTWENVGLDKITLRFFCGGSDYFYYEDNTDVDCGKWAFKKIKRSAFTSSGSPSWDSITQIQFLLWGKTGPGTSVGVTLDDLRIVRADPDDATKGNDTGTVWDFIWLDVWHVEEDMLGCLDNLGVVPKVALIHESPPADVKFLAKVRAKRDAGEVGLVFRCADGTAGSEDMAAFFIDTANDKLELRKWAGGSSSALATAVDETVNPDTDYWLGVWVVEDRVRCYYSTGTAGIWDDENKEFIETKRKFNITNAVFASGGALASGQCGVISIGTLGRFDEVELYGVEDGHVPGDQVQVEAKAIYRTIYPFRE